MPTHLTEMALGLMKIWLFCQILIPQCSSEILLKGLHFLDNELESRFGPENGYATFNTGQPIPDQVDIKKS